MPRSRVTFEESMAAGAVIIEWHENVASAKRMRKNFTVTIKTIDEHECTFTNVSYELMMRYIRKVPEPEPSSSPASHLPYTSLFDDDYNTDSSNLDSDEPDHFKPDVLANDAPFTGGIAERLKSRRAKSRTPSTTIATSSSPAPQSSSSPNEPSPSPCIIARKLLPSTQSPDDHDKGTDRTNAIDGRMKIKLRFAHYDDDSPSKRSIKTTSGMRSVSKPPALVLLKPGGVKCLLKGRQKKPSVNSALPGKALADAAISKNATATDDDPDKTDSEDDETLKAPDPILESTIPIAKKSSAPSTKESLATNDNKENEKKDGGVMRKDIRKSKVSDGAPPTMPNNGVTHIMNEDTIRFLELIRQGGQILSYAPHPQRSPTEFNVTVGMPSGKTHYFPNVTEDVLIQHSYALELKPNTSSNTTVIQKDAAIYGLNIAGLIQFGGRIIHVEKVSCPNGNPPNNEVIVTIQSMSPHSATLGFDGLLGNGSTSVETFNHVDLGVFKSIFLG
ncbi:hypothetical protein SeMB42_g00293 [Synchytrium endobioticum]|uniref:Uncharacterized protein n=1 Tax=Synchytrium endobioticum TaxID=286115 RepID=A0A507CF87_9FUNG|nr:hypothetical protein SeLEV6574_g06749 [Synchytrium endobioticum]TPX54373.1 hypothetical protein SeMB42_g00293 [Synchytrium endobioticum]